MRTSVVNDSSSRALLSPVKKYIVRRETPAKYTWIKACGLWDSYLYVTWNLPELREHQENTVILIFQEVEDQRNWLLLLGVYLR